MASDDERSMIVFVCDRHALTGGGVCRSAAWTVDSDDGEIIAFGNDDAVIVGEGGTAFDILYSSLDPVAGD